VVVPLLWLAQLTGDAQVNDWLTVRGAAEWSSDCREALVCVASWLLAAG
jgi:hypothetical protein